MSGSDFFLLGHHTIGLPESGWVPLSTLDPELAKMEQLSLTLTGWWLAQAASGPSPNVVYIDPSASSYGDGTIQHPYSSWNAVTWTAGSTYLQKAGTVASGAIIVHGSGTDTAPIVMGTYGTGPQAAVKGPVVFDNVHYVAMTGFTVTDSPWGAIVIENGSSHIEIAGNTLTHSGMGLYVTSNAGGSNLIEGNDIHDNTMFGVGVTANNLANDETVIAGNSIHDNGAHGIEIEGNHYIIENNYIAGNGGTYVGSSGIHAFAASAQAGGGSYNTIRYNFAVQNHDTKGQDGNGIELDQFTNNNQVYGNFTSGNDGAGIVLYDAFANMVQNNTMVADQVDPGGTHLARGELVLASHFGLTSDNIISNNTAIANSTHAFAVLVDIQAAAHPETFADNSFLNAVGGNVYYWGIGYVGGDATAWHGLSGATDVFSL